MFNEMCHSMLVESFVTRAGIDDQSAMRDHPVCSLMNDPETIWEGMSEEFHVPVISVQNYL